MKKSLLLSIALGAALVAAPALADTSVAGVTSTGSGSVSVSAPFRFARSLTQGSTGADVTQLQMFLNKTPATAIAQAPRAGSAGHETSSFGPATAAAVAVYQKAHSIPATGIVGPLTLASLNSALSSTQVALPAVVGFNADTSTPGTALLTLKFDGGGENPTIWFAYGVSTDSMTVTSTPITSNKPIGTSEVTLSSLSAGSCYAVAYVKNSVGTVKSNPVSCTK